MSNPFQAINQAAPPKSKHRQTREERLEEDLVSILDELREIAEMRHQPISLCSYCGAFQPSGK